MSGFGLVIVGKAREDRLGRRPRRGEGGDWVTSHREGGGWLGRLGWLGSGWGVGRRDSTGYSRRRRTGTGERLEESGGATRPWYADSCDARGWYAYIAVRLGHSIDANILYIHMLMHRAVSCNVQEQRVWFVIVVVL
jgi:hypothetical protein